MSFIFGSMVTALSKRRLKKGGTLREFYVSPRALVYTQQLAIGAQIVEELLAHGVAAVAFGTIQWHT